MDTDLSVIQGAQGAPPLREDMVLDDVEKNLAAQKATADAAAADAAARTTAERDAKARADALAAQGDDPRVKALQEALRISEEGRLRTEAMRAAPAVVDAGPAKLTEEQLAKLYEENPLKAIAYMQEQANRVLLENVSARLEPLVSGGATSAREMAKAKYPDEFALFGGDIQKMLDDPRVSKSSMNNVQAWDDLISFIRGQPANFEKLIDHRAAKTRSADAGTAQAAQAAAAGAHTRSDVRPPAPTGNGTLDAIEMEIARALAPDKDPEQAYADYRQWKGVATR